MRKGELHLDGEKFPHFEAISVVFTSKTALSYSECIYEMHCGMAPPTKPLG